MPTPAVALGCGARNAAMGPAAWTVKAGETAIFIGSICLRTEGPMVFFQCPRVHAGVGVQQPPARQTCRLTAVAQPMQGGQEYARIRIRVFEPADNWIMRNVCGGAVGVTSVAATNGTDGSIERS